VLHSVHAARSAQTDSCRGPRNRLCVPILLIEPACSKESVGRDGRVTASTLMMSLKPVFKLRISFTHRSLRKKMFATLTIFFGRNNFCAVFLNA
jgi:hypothetical protein